jgi:nucleotide-binding universal stress UspA family protein
MQTFSHPRVVLGVDNSLAGFAALRVAVGVARSRRVPLHAIRAMADMGEVGEQYIRAVFTTALGGIPAEVDLHMGAAVESASCALEKSACDPRDLIVVGNSGKGAARAILSGSVGRSLLKHARCQILIVPTPEMHGATRRSARKLRAERTDVWDRFESEVPQLRGRPYQGA